MISGPTISGSVRSSSLSPDCDSMTNVSVGRRQTCLGTSPIQESRSTKTYWSYHVFACRKDLRVSPPS